MWLFGSSRTKQEQEYIQTMKTELLDVVTLATRQQSKDLLQLKDYILKLKSKMAQPTAEKEHAVHGLVDSVKEIIKSKTLDSGPKFFALLVLKEAMQTPNPELLSYVQKKIISRLHDLADFQRDEPNLESKAPYVLHQYNQDSDPVWSRRFFILNLECLHQWATAYPHSAQGGESEFKKYHDKLIQHGVSFLVKDPQSNFVDEKLKKLEEAAKFREGRTSGLNTQENEHLRAERGSLGNENGRQNTQSKPIEVSAADKAQSRESLDDLWQDLVYLVLQGDSTAYLLEHIDNAMENMVAGLKKAESDLHREFFQKFLKLWRIQSRNFETEDQVEAIRALNTLQIAMKKLNREFEEARKQTEPEKPENDPEEEGINGQEEEQAAHPSQESRGHSLADRSPLEPNLQDAKLPIKRLPEGVFQGQSDPAVLFDQKVAWDVPFMNDGAWGNEEAEKDDPRKDISNSSKKPNGAPDLKFGDNFWFSSPEADKKEPEPTPWFPGIPPVRDSVAAPVKIGVRPTGGFQFDEASVNSRKGGLDLDDFEQASQSQPDKSFRSAKLSSHGQSRLNKADGQPSESVTFKNAVEPRVNTLVPTIAKDSRRTIDASGPGAAVRRSFAELWADEDQQEEEGGVQGRVHRSMLHRLNVSKERTTRLGTSLAIGRGAPRITTDIRDGAGVIKSGGQPHTSTESREPRRGGIHASAESRESSGSKRPARDSNVMFRGKPLDPVYSTTQLHPVQPKLEKSQVADDHLAEVVNDHSSHLEFQDPWATAPRHSADQASDSKFDNFFNNPPGPATKDLGEDMFGSGAKPTHIQDPTLGEHAAPAEALENWFATRPEEQPSQTPTAPLKIAVTQPPQKEASGFRDRSGRAASGDGFDLDDFEAASDNAGQLSQPQQVQPDGNENIFGDDIDLEGIAQKPKADLKLQQSNPPAEDEPVRWGQASAPNIGQSVDEQQSGRDLEEMMGTDKFQSQASKPSKLQPWVFTSGDVPADPIHAGEGEVGTPDHFNPFEFEREGGIDHQTPPQTTLRKATKVYETELLPPIEYKPSPEDKSNGRDHASKEVNRLQLHRLGTLLTRHSSAFRQPTLILTASRMPGVFIGPQSRNGDHQGRAQGTEVASRPETNSQSALALQKELSQHKVDISFLKAELERKNLKIIEVQNSLALATQSVKALEQKEVEQYEQLYTAQKNQEELQDNLRELIGKHTSMMKVLEESQRQERLLKFEVQTLKRQKPLNETGLIAEGVTAETGGMSSTPSLERALKERMEALLSKTVEMQQRILELESDATIGAQMGRVDADMMQNLLQRCQSLTEKVSAQNDEIETLQRRIQDLETCEQECKVIMELASLATSEGEVLRRRFWEWIKPAQGDLASSLLVQFLRTQGTASRETPSTMQNPKLHIEKPLEPPLQNKLALLGKTQVTEPVISPLNPVHTHAKSPATTDLIEQSTEQKLLSNRKEIKP